MILLTLLFYTVIIIEYIIQTTLITIQLMTKLSITVVRSNSKASSEQPDVLLNYFIVWKVWSTDSSLEYYLSAVVTGN